MNGGRGRESDEKVDEEEKRKWREANKGITVLTCWDSWKMYCWIFSVASEGSSTSFPFQEQESFGFILGKVIENQYR